MSTPTPTQAENDAAAMGQHTLLKDYDGSPVDTEAKPPADPPPPEPPEPPLEPDPKVKPPPPEVEPTKAEDEQRTLSFEPLPNPIGYRTRALEPSDDAGAD